MGQVDQTKESVKIARAALEAETHEVVQVSKNLNENLGTAVRRTWRQLLFVWAVVIVLAISYFVVLSNAPKTADVAKLEQSAPGSPGSSSPSVLPSAKALPEPPAIPEGKDLIKVLNQIREAQLKKDIQLFLGVYSADFSDLEKKRELTLNIWRRYDYIDLQFQVNDIQRQDASTILGQVTWNIKARDHKTDEVRTLTKSYQVQFVKDLSGKWVIQKLEGTDDKES